MTREKNQIQKIYQTKDERRIFEQSKTRVLLVCVCVELCLLTCLTLSLLYTYLCVNSKHFNICNHNYDFQKSSITQSISFHEKTYLFIARILSNSSFQFAMLVNGIGCESYHPHVHTCMSLYAIFSRPYLHSPLVQDCSSFCSE